MKRVLLIVIAIPVVLWLGSAIWWALISDESKVRYRILEMSDAFNAGVNRTVMAGIAEDYQDTATGIDHKIIHLYLVTLFLRQRHPETKVFDVRVEIPDQLGIQTEESSGDITASFDLSFTLTSQPTREPWVVRVDVRFDERDGEWLVVRSNFQPLSGKRPF